THMTTHHVSLRRACPALLGQLTPSPGECYLSMNPTQAERASSKMRSYFYPSERLSFEHANRIELGRCGCPTNLFSNNRDKAVIKVVPLSSTCLKSSALSLDFC